MDPEVKKKILDIIEASREEIIEFARELIRIPSPTGEEKEVAEATVAKMKELEYDEVKIDEIGNVIGHIKGKGAGKKLMYNGHMDTISPGDLKLWTTDPYGAEIKDGYIYGRGAADMKGANAAAIMAGGLLKRAGIKLSGSLFVTTVVYEEPSTECIGTKWLFEHDGIIPDYVINGEATSMNIANGNRGRVEFVLSTFGKACHSSAPWRGVNALYKMCKAIRQLEELNEQLPEHPELGRASLAVTRILCYPGKLDEDVVPDKCTIWFERRLVPPETPESAMLQIREILQRIEKEDPEFRYSLDLREVHAKMYTGWEGNLKKVMGKPWIISKDHELVKKAVNIISDVTGRIPEIRPWTFGTDALYTAGVAKVPTIGFGPGEERYTHIPDERIKIDDMINATKVYALMAVELCGLAESP